MSKKKKKKVVKKVAKKQTRAQQIASIKKQAQGIQASLNKSIASGQIKSSGSSSKTPVKTKAQLEQELISVQNLAKQTATKAASQGKDVTGINNELSRSQAMQAQGQAEGDKPFAGSSYEQEFLNQTPDYQAPTTDPTPEDIANTISQNTPEQAQGYQPDQTQTDPNAQEQQVAQDNVMPVSGGQQQGFQGSQGGQTQTQVPPTASVVDYLNSTGQASDFNSRARLAEQLGINGYTGTAQQNTQMISALRGAPVSPQEEAAVPTSTAGFLESTQSVPVQGATTDSWMATQQKFGITQTQNDFNSDPMKAIADITKQVLKASGLNEANSAIKDISQELEDLENSKDDEIREINDDPWLTEGVRIRQINKIEQKYEDRIGNRVNKLGLLESVRDNAQQQANFSLSTAIGVWDSERKWQATQVQMMQDQSQREFENAYKLATMSGKSEGTSEMQEYTFAVEQGFGGTFLDYKSAIAAAGRAPSSGGGNGLTNAQINSTINSIAGAFDNEPIVKQFNVLQEGYQFANSLSNTTKNPADDQGLIYAFAKAMDPNSVVREGEYATVQKYAQSWAKAYGGTINQAISGTGFLSESARKSIKDTIKTKYQASKTNYDNVYNQYQGRIQNAQQGGFNTLTDYSKAYNQPVTYGPIAPTDVFDEVVSTPTASGGFFSNFLTGLFGK